MYNFTYESLQTFEKYSSLILLNSCSPPASAIKRASVVRPAFMAISAAYSRFPISKFFLMMHSTPSSQLAFLEMVSVTVFVIFDVGRSSSSFWAGSFYSSLLLLWLLEFVTPAYGRLPSWVKKSAALSAVIGFKSYCCFCAYGNYYAAFYGFNASCLGLRSLRPRTFSTSWTIFVLSKPKAFSKSSNFPLWRHFITVYSSLSKSFSDSAIL